MASARRSPRSSACRAPSVDHAVDHAKLTPRQCWGHAGLSENGFMQTKPVLSSFLLLAACSGDPTQMQNAPDGSPEPVIDSPTPKKNGCEQLGLTPSQMRTDLPWYGNNRADLQGWFDSVGCASATFDPTHKPIATLDWDNTISKNDFGDAITYYMVANGKV